MKFKTRLQEVSGEIHNKNSYLILALFVLIFSRYFICEAYSFLRMHNHGVAFSRSIIGRCFLSEMRLLFEQLIHPRNLACMSHLSTYLMQIKCRILTFRIP